MKITNKKFHFFIDAFKQHSKPINEKQEKRENDGTIVRERFLFFIVIIFLKCWTSFNSEFLINLFAAKSEMSFKKKMQNYSRIDLRCTDNTDNNNNKRWKEKSVTIKPQKVAAAFVGRASNQQKRASNRRRSTLSPERRLKPWDRLGGPVFCFFR